MPGGGPPHGCRLCKHHPSGLTATKSVWPVLRGRPSLRFSWNGGHIPLKSQLCP